MSFDILDALLAESDCCGGRIYLDGTCAECGEDAEDAEEEEQ